MDRVTTADLNDPVTRHMHRDVRALRVDQTVGKALEQLRANPPSGRIIYLYVLDGDDRLAGVVPTRQLLLSTPDVPIREIMIARPVAVPARATVLEACEFFTLHRFLAFPVVDDQRRLLGVIDVEMYTDELSEIGGDSRENLFQLIGVHLTAAQQLSPWQGFRSRFPWLLCNVAGGVVAAFLSGLFEAELQKVVALALFIPVVLALAESVSIQSVSLALEMMAGERPSWRSLLPRLRAEGLVGLMLGAACAATVAVVAYLWLGDARVVLCLLGGITGGVAIAAVLGLGVPYLLRILKRRPQVASGPLALALADMATLLLYFNLARSVLA